MKIFTNNTIIEAEILTTSRDRTSCWTNERFSTYHRNCDKQNQKNENNFHIVTIFFFFCEDGRRKYPKLSKLKWAFKDIKRVCFLYWTFHILSRSQGNHLMFNLITVVGFDWWTDKINLTWDFSYYVWTSHGLSLYSSYLMWYFFRLIF